MDEKVEGESRSVTAADVARRAGVSRSTVSRAFSVDRSVKPATRRRILKAAEELGYFPNALAQALISRRSAIVGIVMGEMYNPFHAILHSALTSRLQAAGYIPLTAQLGRDKSIGDAVTMFRQYRVGVVLLTSMSITDDMVAACHEGGLKLALLNRIDEGGVAAAVCADLEQGGALAAARMVEIGRSRIALVEGFAGSWTSRARLAGQLKGLTTSGIEPVAVLNGDYTYEAGLAAAGALFGGDGVLPDGVMCANDLNAMGLMDAARSRFGLRIPEDVAVIGFDDIPMASWSSFDLTTVRLPVNRMIERVLDLVGRMMTEPQQVSERVLIPCRLVRRGSA